MSPATTYAVLRGHYVGNPETEYRLVYDTDERRFTDLPGAMAHGMEILGSDDFNIAVIEGGEVVALNWMEEVVDTDPQILRDAAEALGIAS